VATEGAAMPVKLEELNVWVATKLFNEMPLNIAVIDRDYGICVSNEKFVQRFGKCIDRKCYEVLKQRSEPCVNCEAMKTFSDGMARKYEECINEAEYYMVNIIPVVDPGGNTIRIISMLEDITDIHNRQMECEIFFERVPNYISVIDRDFTIVRANDNLRDTFGECNNRKCYEVYKKKHRACENCPAALSFIDGQEHTAEHVGMSADGSITYYVVKTSPLIKGYDNCRYVVEILTDITEFKMLEKEKLEAERLAAVGQTVAGLAHTIKNILMGVEGGMYMLSSGIEQDQKDRMAKGWDMLQRNIVKVSSLVKDFLSFAKGRKPVLQIIDPNCLVDEIIELYESTAKRIGITLTRNPSDGVEPAPLDAAGIHTCLTNLISNAIDACQMSSKENPSVRIGLKQENDTLYFEVSDDGCGMDYDVKQKLFTTFFTTKGGKGTGLGLLTTNKIVHEHGGKILYTSESGKGSVFTIAFPLHVLYELYNESRDTGGTFNEADEQKNGSHC